MDVITPTSLKFMIHQGNVASFDESHINDDYISKLFL